MPSIMKWTLVVGLAMLIAFCPFVVSAHHHTTIPEPQPSWWQIFLYLAVFLVLLVLYRRQE